jgi:type I restriction enzyme S subunit
MSAASVVPLKAHAIVVAGQSPEGKFYNQEGEGLPFYQGKKDFGHRDLLPPSTWTTQVTKEAMPGDILMSVRAPVGPINFAQEQICIGRGLAVIRCREGLDRDFLFYQLLAMQDQIAGKEGAVFASINKADIEALPINVSPLPEQRRIVAILDVAFEAIATAKANTEKNLQNATGIYESALDLALSHHDGGYNDTTLGAEVELLAGYAFSSEGYVAADEGVRLLRGDNIMQGYLRWDDAKGWPAADVAPYGRFALREGDVVLAMDRPWVKAGLKRAQIVSSDLPCLLLQRTARLRPCPRLRVDFLFHLVGSRLFSRHLLGLQTGTGVPHISGKQIESFRFMLPPLLEQEVLATRLDDLQQGTERLAEVYEQKTLALNELKKSLLHQAFSGAL